MNDIEKVISHLEQQRATIDRAIAALREVGGLKPTKAPPAAIVPPTEPKKRQLSAAGRRRISEATKKRWVEKRAADAAQAKKAVTRGSTPIAKKATRKNLRIKTTSSPTG